jgi:hypothetical protein
MRNTADETGGLQSVSGVSAVGPSVAFRHSWKKGEELFYFSVPDTTRDLILIALQYTSSSAY